MRVRRISKNADKKERKMNRNRVDTFNRRLSFTEDDSWVWNITVPNTI